MESTNTMATSKFFPAQPYKDGRACCMEIFHRKANNAQCNATQFIAALYLIPNISNDKKQSDGRCSIRGRAMFTTLRANNIVVDIIMTGVASFVVQNNIQHTDFSAANILY